MATMVKHNLESLVDLFSNGREKFFVSVKQVAWMQSLRRSCAFKKGRIERIGPWDFVLQYNGAGEVRRVYRPEYQDASKAALAAVATARETACVSREACEAFIAAARESNRILDLLWCGNGQNRALTDWVYVQ